MVESGNLSAMPDRLGLVVSILAGIGYDAVGVGETDLRVSGSKLYEEAAKNKLNVLDATPEAPKTALPYIVKNVGGVKVGVISFGAAKISADQNEYTKRKSLYVAYKTARAASDILVVLDEANLVSKEWLERNGQRLGAPDVVITGVQRAYVQKDESVGKTHLVPTSTQGKHVGVIDVKIVDGQDPAFNCEKVAVDPTVAEDAGIAARIKEFMAKIQVPSYAPGQHATPQYVTADGGKPYYPSILCRTCHVKEYDDWKGTKHAAAIKTLTAENRAIPECLKCHSEQFRKQQRVNFPADGVGGVECASCHIDSLPHGMERKNQTVKAKVDPKTCVECHDRENSPKYDEQPYMARVSHSGKTPSPTAASQSTTPPPSIK